MKYMRPARYASLPTIFYSEVPVEITGHEQWLDINPLAIKQLGLDVDPPGQRQSLTLKASRADEQITPISTIYAGHQFGIYSSCLGDGRAALIGELRDEFNQWWEIQLKGAGPTPYSRGLDGKANLESVLREYLASEALSALGLPSTRSLGILTDGHSLNEHGLVAEAVLVRYAPSHIRFGHFEYFHNQDQPDLVKVLADFLISHYYPQLAEVEERQRYLQLLYVITERTASLVAKWQAIGFVHSVMNTDNMSAVGITMDYGPYAFMEQYIPDFLPNTSDEQGRYAFDQQAEIGRWNCLALAEAFIHLLPSKTIPANLLRLYRQRYSEHYLAEMRRKLGLLSVRAEDQTLIQDLLQLMSQYQTDYALFFRMLSFYPSRESRKEFMHMFANSPAFTNWLNAYETRFNQETATEQQRYECMLNSNPKYILRKHLLEEVIQAASKHSDYSPLKALLKLIQSPYDEHPEFDRLSWPVEEEQRSVVSQAS